MIDYLLTNKITWVWGTMWTFTKPGLPRLQWLYGSGHSAFINRKFKSDDKNNPNNSIFLIVLLFF